MFPRFVNFKEGAKLTYDRLRLSYFAANLTQYDSSGTHARWSTHVRLSTLPRTQTSLSMCAQRKAGSRLYPSHGPLRFITSHSFRARLCHAKNEAPEEEAAKHLFRTAGSLRGRRLKANRKGILGAREARNERGLSPKFSSPSLSNACHAFNQKKKKSNQSKTLFHFEFQKIA